MTRRSSLWLWCLPLSFVGACVLPGFENVPDVAPAEGGSDSGGSMGTSGGAGGEEPASGGGAGGEGPAPEQPEPVDDTFVVQQGKRLTVAAANGVLANDGSSGLRVTGFNATDKDRPEEYDGELDIADDGSVTFTPAADFFGRYYADYTVANEGGQTATARVTFIVQPVSASLDAVQEGIGGVTLTGSAGDELGVSLAGVGDVNADGFDDLAIGAPGADGGAGAVYIVFGSSSFGALTLGSLAASSKETRFAVLAGSGSERVGTFVAAAGRYDSDRVADIVIGSPQAGQGDGALYLAFGGQGLKTTTALAAMPEGRGLVIGGKPQFGQRLGTIVAGAGDYDGNQKSDLLTGFYELGDTTKGLGVVLETAAQDSTIDNVMHKTVTDSTFELPSSLCFAGDVTGDGKDDILASSLQYIALLPGSGSGNLVGDLAQVSADGSQGGFRLERPIQPSTVGASLAPAGDVNGDGRADLVYCDGGVGQSKCEILFGNIEVGRKLDEADWSASGFAAAPALPLVAPGADLNQDDFSELLFADETAAYVVFGRDAGFGAVDVGSLGSDGFSLAAPTGGSIAAVATIGDINGDGYGDFAASDPAASGGSGRVYVVLGGPYSADQR